MIKNLLQIGSNPQVCINFIRTVSREDETTTRHGRNDVTNTFAGKKNIKKSDVFEVHKRVRVVSTTRAVCRTAGGCAGVYRRRLVVAAFSDSTETVGQSTALCGRRRAPPTHPPSTPPPPSAPLRPPPSDGRCCSAASKSPAKSPARPRAWRHRRNPSGHRHSGRTIFFFLLFFRFICCRRNSCIMKCVHTFFFFLRTRLGVDVLSGLKRHRFFVEIQTRGKKNNKFETFNRSGRAILEKLLKPAA